MAMTRPITRKPTRRTSKPLARKAHGVANGYRSGFEEKIDAELTAADVEHGFETEVIPYVKPEKKARYTPDFPVKTKSGHKIYIETKGRFLTADRQKHLLIQNQRPDLDIRFVFMRSATPISKGSKTTYASWCEKHGFKYADKSVPSEWLNE